MKIFPVVFGLVFSLSCSEKETKEVMITVVDIGQNNRIELGKQLRVINKFSPKVVGLDFHLVRDSADVDTILVKELNILKNSVQVVALHNLIEQFDYWDSLEISNPKFNVANVGFANITTTDEDSIFVRELPMQQLFRERTIYSFSYAVAQNSFGVKSQYTQSGTESIHLSLKDLGKNFKLITRRDLTSGNFKKEDLNGKIVLLGYIGPSEDHFFIDENKKERINGVILQAAIINEITDF